MSENKGKIYDDINRLPKVSYEAAIEILEILQEAAKDFPEISRYYVESKFSSDDRVSGGRFRYEQYVYDMQKWQKKWLGSTKGENKSKVDEKQPPDSDSKRHVYLSRDSI